MKTIIDPPVGSAFGFPRALPEPPPEDINKWLVSVGYPQSLIDQFHGELPYRMWHEEDAPETDQ